MTFKAARRVGIAVGASIVAWFASSLIGVWLFGSANFLAWVIAVVVGVGVYLALRWRDGHLGATGSSASAD